MRKVSKAMSFQKRAKKAVKIKDSFKRKRSLKHQANEEVKRHKAEFLDIKTIREGMLLLGCIIEIRSDCILMSLPSCLVGVVPISNISREYTEAIKNCFENDEMVLDQIFELGAKFPCKVLKIECHISKKPSIILSIDPEAVNCNIKWQSLYSKMVLYTTVVSIEDYGYVMNTGIKNVQGFLPFNATVSSKLLVPGQVVPTCIIKIPSYTDAENVISLVCLNFEDAYPEISSDDVKLSAILPGARVSAYISEVTQQFAYMKCLNYDACSCLISAHNYKKSIKESAMVFGTVLYVHPITNAIYIHLGSLPTPNTFCNFFSLQKYDRIKNLKFYASHHQRLFFKHQNLMTYVKSSEVAEKPTFVYNTLVKNPLVPKGRVIFLHYMDNLVEITFKESMLKMKIVRPEEVKVGDIYEATVKKITEDGIYVSICPGLSGFVRNAFCSDSFLTMPEKLFPVGTTVKCRVLSIHPKSGLNLTCKESLVSLSQSDLLKSYEEAKRDNHFKGVIIKKTNEYMLVLFWNNVKGIVSAENIPKSSIFYVGQTVSCFVIRSDPVKNKLKLSLTKQNYSTSVNKEKSSVIASDMYSANLIQNSSKSVFSEGKTYNAYIKKIAAHQLNIVVDGGIKGRVHVTQTGYFEKSTLPLHQFTVGQRLKVYVLKEYEKYRYNSSEITHKNKNLLECSLVYPPIFPLSGECNKPFIGFIKKGYESHASVWLSPYEWGIIDYVNLSKNPKDLRKLKKNLRIGQSIEVSVLATSTPSPKCKKTNISLVNPDISAPIVGKNSIGFIKEANLNNGLRLNLPHKYSGFVYPTNIQDEYLPLQPMVEKISKLKFILCHVLEVNDVNKTCVLSIKNSRVASAKGSTISIGLSAETLQPGMKIKGYIKYFCDSYILVNIGDNLIGKVSLHKCDLYKCVKCHKVSEIIQKCAIGNVIEVNVDNFSNNDFVPLSLPGVLNKDSPDSTRLVVKEDINWNDFSQSS